jgi:uncharacterized protein
MNRLILARAWKSVAVALVFGLMSSMASAQQGKAPSPANLQLARDIISVSGTGHVFDSIVPSVMQQAFTNFLTQNPDLQKPLVETMTALQPEFQKQQSEVIDIMANAYASHFTEAEMKDILAFYNSASGKKMIAELPKIGEESVTQARAWGTKLSEQVVARVREEMKKKGHTI